MSTKSNVYSQGSGGTLYELEVQTAYFINFLIGGTVPGIHGGRIVEYRQQSSSLGFNTDDLLLNCIDSSSAQQKILFQIKHNLIISEKSELFVEVLINSWKDFNNASLFNKLNDKIYLIKNDLTLNEKNHLKQILNWAKIKATVADFINEVNRIQSKSNYFELFKSIISAGGNSVSDSDLFDFFKCFDLLEYDFGNEASTSKAHFLSLVDLAKSDSLESSAGIWNSVFTFISGTNSKGGFFTTSNIPAELSSFFNTHYYTPAVKDLKRFSTQNLEIIKFIEDSIGGVHIDRLQFIQESIEKLNETKFLILSGGPGAGKSAIAKAILKSISHNSSGYIISFKADELINKNLRDIFAAFNINITINEVFSHFPLNQDNIIYIDSAEKLLEGEGIGFIQLLASVQNIPNIKFIISCRSSNLNLIERKFFFDRQYSKLDVPVLNDEELDELQIQLPVIQKLRLNKRILPLIRNPKYLDYSVKAISNVNDFSEATEIDFVNKLWEAIVENRLNMDYEGLPLRRSSLFIDLAVKRAKAMVPFIPLDDVDKIALDSLLKENVVVKSSVIESFSPAHDVLEDWALIRYVSNEFLKKNNDSDFYERLGTEPAMRRAYRLWVQDSLKEQNNLKVEFFTRSFKSNTLDKFWQDESLIAVLNSSYCQSFFENNLSLFKANNWSLFFRSVHIMRTACRENSQAFHGSKYMIPTGHGWLPIINIIHKHLAEIPETYYTLIYHAILDWSAILNTTQNNIEGTKEAGLIAIYLHENMFLKYSKDADEDVLVENSLKLIFELCGGIVTEVEGILRKAIKQTAKAETDKNWESRRYHEKILSLSLSGIKSGKLATYLPDLLIEIAKGYWYEKPRIKVKNQDSIIDLLSEQHSPGDVNHYFGLGNNFDLRYFPSSAYQTPILWLLRNHPIKTIDFICELINVTTQKYAASEFSEDDGCTEIELIMPDGIKITQTGSIVLWTMYRGTGRVTPYLLQSILMALEHYLFEIAEFGDAYKGLLQKVLDQLYFKSKSVATTAVISSLCQAFPALVGEKLLPLFTNRKLISWDVSRYTGDFHPFDMMFNYDVYELEREKSNKLPHRLKHTPGLKGFIVDYCFNVRLFNKEIFEIIDKYRADAKPDDYEWRKILDDMDVRTWRLTKEVTHDGKTGVMIEPSYSEDIMTFANEAKGIIDESSKNSSFKVALIRAEKEEEVLAIEKWREIYLYYISIHELQFFEHTPGLLAVIGVRDLWNDLNAQEKEWCLKLILEITNKSIEKQYHRYSTSFEISPFDNGAILSVVPLLMDLIELKKERKDFEILVITVLITHFQLNDTGYAKFIKAISISQWEIAPERTLKLFHGVIAFAKFTKENRFYIDHPYSDEERQKYFNKYDQFIRKVYRNKLNVNLPELNFSNYSHWVLQKAIYMVPAINPPMQCISFLHRMVECYIESESKDRHSRGREERVHEIRIALTDKLSNIIFWNPNEVGYSLMRYLFSKIHDVEVLTKAFKRNNEIFLFFRSTLRNLITIPDAHLPLDDNERTQMTITNFQLLWKQFDEILSGFASPLFTNIFLLDIEWKDTSITWKPMESMPDFFQQAILKYGHSNHSSLVNLLSHIGDKTLLPKGINTLVKILKESKEPVSLNSIKYSDKLINRIYENHLDSVKVDKELLGNYFWMLNEMTEQGSSEAYWIREFLISFK